MYNTTKFKNNFTSFSSNNSLLECCIYSFSFFLPCLYIETLSSVCLDLAFGTILLEYVSDCYEYSAGRRTSTLFIKFWWYLIKLSHVILREHEDGSSTDLKLTETRGVEFSSLLNQTFLRQTDI